MSHKCFFLRKKIQEFGQTIFHAGDLNWWHWAGEPDPWNPEMAQKFKAYTAPLKGRRLDLALLPLDPRQGEDGFLGPKQFAPRKAQRHTYRRCVIQGDIDFIYGGAAAWFEDCEIRSVDGRRDRSHPCEGYVTAASTPEGQRFGYLFHHCRFTAESVAAASVYLGRPWRDWAKTLLIDCELGAHIHPECFHDWNKPQAHDTMNYAEYGSVGPGAAGPRATFCRTMQREAAEQLTYAYFMAHALEQTLV